jgi:hypothetical protein
LNSVSCRQLRELLLCALPKDVLGKGALRQVRRSTLEGPLQQQLVYVQKKQHLQEQLLVILAHNLPLFIMRLNRVHREF